MENASERLTAKMMKLPADDWVRLLGLGLASRQQQGRFRQAKEDELTERLAPSEPTRRACAVRTSS